MSELLKVNVNDHTEQKNGLTYLSWAWAWAEVLKLDNQAEWELVEYGQPDGSVTPCMYVGEGSAMVKVKVTIKGKTRCCTLPVMNHRNQAIKNPDAFQVNTAVMRCLAKGIAMHGLGLYIYAGEDMPQEDAPVGHVKLAALHGIGDDLPDDEKQYLKDVADYIKGVVQTGNIELAVKKYAEYRLDDTQTLFVDSLLDSKTRSALRKQNTQKAA